MAGDRLRRVNEALREVLSARIAEGLKDTRVGFVTVTGVETSPDLRHARVYVSVLGDREESLAGLEASKGLLQRAIADDMRIKYTPQLNFVYDETVEKGMRITELLDSQEGHE